MGTGALKLDDIDAALIHLGWTRATLNDSEGMWARPEHERTSVIHAIRDATGIQARVVVRDRIPMRNERFDLLRVKQPAALRGTMDGDQLMALLREGL